MKRLATKPIAATTLIASLLAGGSALAQDAQSSGGEASPATMESKTVTMNAPDGSDRGTVTITPTPHGLLFEANLSGFSEGGIHAFHIHETGTCGEDFGQAGGHYNPTDKDHGYMAENGPHAGDMPNFTVAGDGTAKFSTFNPMVTMTGGEAPLDDDDGSALMVHGGADDYASQPSGDAGDRVACGVIFPAE